MLQIMSKSEAAKFLQLFVDTLYLSILAIATLAMMKFKSEEEKCMEENSLTVSSDIFIGERCHAFYIGAIFEGRNEPRCASPALQAVDNAISWWADDFFVFV